MRPLSPRSLPARDRRLLQGGWLLRHAEHAGGPSRGQSGAVVAVQRTSSDLKLNPHVHAVFLDGAYRDKGDELDFRAVSFEPRPMVFERPLCVALDGLTLHAATRAGGHDVAGREVLLKYVLRPAVAQERVTRGPDGLVRIMLKKPFSDVTVAVDLDPLSLLSRLAASVPAPRLHTVRTRGCSRRRVRSGPVSRRSPRCSHRRTRRTGPRDRAEAAIGRGRSCSREPLGWRC